MKNVHVRIKIELLKNHCRGSFYKFRFVFVSKKFAVYINFAGRGFFQKVHTAHGGGFSAAGRPDYNQLFAFFYFKVNVFKYMEAAEIFIYIDKFYQCFHLRINII